jgi:E3 SUMO-protein ligase PIAS1
VQLQRVTSNFTLSDEEVAKIKDASNPLQVRMVCLSVENNQGVHCWPVQGTCQVNGSANLKLTYRSAGYPHIGIPEIISEHVKEGVNSFQVFNPYESNRNYVVLIDLVEVETVEMKIKKLKETSVISFADGLKKVVDQFKSNDTDELSMDSTKISLRCPLGLARIGAPGKGKDCVHIQCFDLTTFISFYQNSTSVAAWSCPVCNKPSSNLIFDGYFDKILADTKDVDAEKSELSVLVQSDGSYKLIDTQNKRKREDSASSAEHFPPQKKSTGSGTQALKPAAEIIAIESDNDDDIPMDDLMSLFDRPFPTPPAARAPVYGSASAPIEID